MRLFKLLLFTMLFLIFNQSFLLAADETPAANSGDSQTHYLGFPIFSDSPETGIAVGGMFMGYRNSKSTLPQGKMDMIQGILIYTEKEQIILSLDVTKYFHDDRYLIMAHGGYVDFPDKFYGIGPDTDEDLEEDYTLISKPFQGSFLLRLTPDIYLGPSVVYCRLDIEDRTEGGLLAAGDINGSDGTTVSGAGLKLLRDTRDDGFQPQHGSLLDAQVTSYRKSWGSDEDFSQFVTTYRQFWPIRQTKTLAFLTALFLSDGTVPFEMMPCLGGGTIMRGYYGGRYRDRNYAALQGEYRFPINARFSGVAFASLGEVAPEIDQFNSDNLRVAGGFGGRFRIDPNQKINLRLDIGVSEDGVYTYINFMEAF